MNNLQILDLAYHEILFSFYEILLKKMDFILFLYLIRNSLMIALTCVQLPITMTIVFNHNKLTTNPLTFYSFIVLNIKFRNTNFYSSISTVELSYQEK